MPRALISTLHNGIEIAFLLALLSASLRGSGQTGLVSRLKWGAALAVAVSSALTYGVISGWNRETVELAINGLAVVFAVSLAAWLGWTCMTASKKTESKAGLGASSLIFLAAAVLVTLPALDIALRQTRIFLGLDRPTIADQMTTVGAPLLVLVAIAGIILHKVAARIRLRSVALITIAALAVLLVRDGATAVEVSLVKGIIPLTDWLFRLIVPVVNNYAAFFYVFLAAAAALLLLAVRERRLQADSFEGFNPAQVRKMRVTVRRTGALLAAFGIFLALVVVNDGASAVFANRPPQLSPAVPVGAENGQMRIPMDSVADGLLHRFSYTTAEQITVRFLLIYKGSGIYGVGLDACEFCGVAGYRQEKENVICNRCNAAINKTTIGFPGGCNPIPLPYQEEGNFVTIPLEKIEAVKAVFVR